MLSSVCCQNFRKFLVRVVVESRRENGRKKNFRPLLRLTCSTPLSFHRQSCQTVACLLSETQRERKRERERVNQHSSDTNCKKRLRRPARCEMPQLLLGKGLKILPLKLIGSFSPRIDRNCRQQNTRSPALNT